ncbi:hypothetical protein IFM12275_69230 (plasmid) [Nocardia sputorum]|uniref:hypothetical protein n=1 Tax=Nocardia sputorum TaxID=2984338 RepID=UPI0024916483|nr:hypothetical protein [Nocardia sputorum]BDT96947.1 hypothetical protein IFM12275_69230 [Nocardia sputorum]
MTQYPYRYTCSRCLVGWHYVSYCPYRQPITPAELRAVQRLVELERAGVMELARPLDMRWLWLVPPAVVIFGLIVLFS